MVRSRCARAARASVTGVTIVPDTKDWTWVLARPCPECGLDTGSFARAEIPAMIRANSAAWRAPLAAPGAGIRPRPDKWSPLEYGCHVRDVFKLFDYRLGLMLTEDDPFFANWDQDATATADRYDQQDPARVTTELSTAGEVLATSFASVSGDQWLRPGRRSDGASFTVETFGRYLMHDPVHHLYDVTGIRQDRLPTMCGVLDVLTGTPRDPGRTSIARSGSLGEPRLRVRGRWGSLDCAFGVAGGTSIARSGSL